VKPGSRCERAGPLPDQSMWYLLWKKWQKGQVILVVLQLYLVSVILNVFHGHLFICHRYYIMSSTEQVIKYHTYNKEQNCSKCHVPFIMTLVGCRVKKSSIFLC